MREARLSWQWWSNPLPGLETTRTKRSCKQGIPEAHGEPTAKEVTKLLPSDQFDEQALMEGTNESIPRTPEVLARVKPAAELGIGRGDSEFMPQHWLRPDDRLELEDIKCILNAIDNCAACELDPTIVRDQVEVCTVFWCDWHGGNGGGGAVFCCPLAFVGGATLHGAEGQSGQVLLVTGGSAADGSARVTRWGCHAGICGSGRGLGRGVVSRGAETSVQGKGQVGQIFGGCGNNNKMTLHFAPGCRSAKQMEAQNMIKISLYEEGGLLYIRDAQEYRRLARSQYITISSGRQCCIKEFSGVIGQEARHTGV
ncbi:hypothetical protein B0H10DRAFT_1957251 [Mycena sp. CBHHK59/15]|nr:hypothetical protein B0H10DRAFT_1957251 [Mycena sp. CBHHK59/15]